MKHIVIFKILVLILELIMVIEVKSDLKDTTSFLESVELVPMESIRDMQVEFLMDFETQYLRFPKTDAFIFKVYNIKDSVARTFFFNAYKTLDSSLSSVLYDGFDVRFHNNDILINPDNFNKLYIGLDEFHKYISHNHDDFTVDEDNPDYSKLYYTIIRYRGHTDSLLTNRDWLIFNLNPKKDKLLSILKEHVDQDLYKQLELYITSIVKYFKKIQSDNKKE